MNDNSTKIRIPCHRKIKEYNAQHLADISAMNVSEVYNSLSASGGIITKKAATCKKQLEALIEKVGKFKPSVPMTQDEQTKIAQIQQIWLSHLNRQLNDLSVPVKPTYLRDSVTHILQSKGVNDPCTNRHLEWYLVRYNVKQLNPAEVADAIIQHSGSDWATMPQLIKDADYNITVAKSNKTESQNTRRTDADFTAIRSVFEFIESFPATPGIETLDAKLANDITIADMVLSWRKKNTTRYDNYMTVFQTFINSLQTLPDEARKITFADTTEQVTFAKKKSKAGTKKTKPNPKREKKTAAGTADVSANSDSSANYARLTAFLKKKANEDKIPYLAGNITEPKNIEYIKRFANRPDFDDIFAVLEKNSNRPVSGQQVTATEIMNYIRDVAIRNETNWN